MEAPRGTYDLLPPASEEMLALVQAAQDSARRFGYRAVETPAFEYTEIFKRSSGETSDVVTKEMYTFEDQGGRSLTLRPEGTAPVVRAWLAQRQSQATPFKASYTGTMWRHGRPQAGRLREFHQWGIEVIGTDSPEADIEVIALASGYLQDRGLEQITLSLNSIGDASCRPAYRETLLSFLRSHRDELCHDCRARMESNPLRSFDCKEEGCRAVMVDAPLISAHLCDACREHFVAVQAGLDREAIAYELDDRLVRGLDYYTRTVFEFASSVLSSSQSGVCGGGRYDGLAEILEGPDTPAIGFAMGLERVILAIQGEDLGIKPAGRPQCFVVVLGADAVEPGRALVRTLRREGVGALMAFEDRPMKAQLKMADKSGAAFAAIIGDREIEERKVTLRRLEDGEQFSVDLWEVPAWLTQRA